MKKSLDFVRKERSTAILMNTEVNVIVDCMRLDTLILELTDEFYTKRKTLMAESFAEMKSDESFNIRVANSLDTPVKLEDDWKIEYAVEAPYAKEWKN